MTYLGKLAAACALAFLASCAPSTGPIKEAYFSSWVLVQIGIFSVIAFFAGRVYENELATKCAESLSEVVVASNEPNGEPVAFFLTVKRAGKFESWYFAESGLNACECFRESDGLRAWDELKEQLRFLLKAHRARNEWQRRELGA